MPSKLLRYLLNFMLLKVDDDGAAAVQISDEQLADQGLTREDFNALSPREQEALAADTPDDTTMVSDQEAAAANAAREAQQREEAAKKAAQQPTPAPTEPPASPAPTQPPASPAPTEPPVSPAPTQAPAATHPPAATQAPVDTGGWTAVPQADVEDTLLPPLRIAPKDAEDQRKTLKTEKATLFKQYDEGTLSSEDYQAKVAEIDDKLEALNTDIAADKAAAAQFRAQSEARWGTMVRQTLTVMGKAAGAAINTNEAVMNELDAAVRRYASAAPLMHPTKSPLFRDQWALAMARDEVAMNHGWKIEPPAGTQPPQTTQAPRKPADMSHMPPTLRNAPPAGDPNIAAGEFDHLDAMPNAEREKVVATFDDAKMERYLDR